MTREQALQQALENLLVDYHCYRPGNPYCVDSVREANKLLAGDEYENPPVAARVHQRKHG